jgi:cytoskeletal protein CcmA (bactofilin family)/DNA-directed RNA polymerase subunit RPC12/RpoP
MPASPQDKVQLTCPHCGHQQLEPRTAFSSVCRKCGEHLRVQEILKPAPKSVESGPARRRITCFDCGAELDVPATAESTMCKKCSRYIDLKDYKITSAVSKNFKTKGSFVVEAKGYVFNTEAIVADAVIKGRFLGKLTAQRSLSIYSTAEIKGKFTTAHLIIPAANHFHWPEPIGLDSGEIAGELSANLKVKGTLLLKSSARMFGDVNAGNLVVEDGAVVVGNLTVCSKTS